MKICSIQSTKKQGDMALKKVEDIVSSNPVVVFSKTYCDYSKRVKQLLTRLEARYKVIELDKKSDGRDIQLALAEWTGLGTVPNVFIAGKNIGGCESVVEKYQEGQLVLLLAEAGAIATAQE